MDSEKAAEIVLKLPDFVSLTPFQWAGCNTVYSPFKRESTEWMLGYGIFPSPKGPRRLVATNPELLAAYAYPYADAKGLRSAGDLLTILFSLDEVTDVQNESDAIITRDTFANGLKGESSGDASPIALFAKDFVGRLPSISDELLKRLVVHFIGYMDATAKEAGNRANASIPTFEEHVRLRRDNGGLFTAFDAIEIALGFTLPGEVLNDKDFQSIVLSANDMVCYVNDMYSFTTECADGLDGSNSISVLMFNKGLSYQEATNEIGNLYKKCAETFVTCKEAMRSFGQEIDEMVHAYVCGLEQWVAGHNAWNMETRRFFNGDAGADDMKRQGLIKITCGGNKGLTGERISISR